MRLLTARLDSSSGPLAHTLYPGDAARPALLLIHPLGADKSFWDECIGLWQPALTCVACDLRSAGLSPRSGRPVSIAQHVADLESLRRELGIESVIPVGCAIGAMIAASYAATYPERTASLVLSNPAAATSEEAMHMLRDRAAQVQRSGMEAILPGAVDKPFLQQPDDARRRRYAERFARQDALAYATSILGIVDADVRPDLLAVGCPSLVTAGAHDVLFPPEQARQVWGLLRRARYVLFEDAAHFVPYQKPAEFAQLVRDFLSDVSRPTNPNETTGELHRE